MQPEDLKCSSCGNGLIGRGVLLIPVVEEDEQDNRYADPLLLHPTCFNEVIDSVFQQEGTTHFEIFIGTAFNLWAGLFTKDDEEAGIPSDGH